MKTIFKYCCLLLIFLVSNISLAQSVFTSNCPDYQIDIKKTSTQPCTTAAGLHNTNGCSSVSVYTIGKNGDTRKRGVYQWSINDLQIPDGSTINSITLTFHFTPLGYNDCDLKYFSVNTDITQPNLNLEDLWTATDYTLQGIGYGFGNNNTNYDIISTFTQPNDPFIVAFVNSLSQDRFTLGFAWRYESPTAGNREWLVTTGSPTLTVNFTPPNQTVTLDQRLSNNSQVGKLRKWEGTQFTPSPYINPGTSFNFPVSSNQTIQGDQAIYSNEKYYKWIRNTTGHKAKLS